LTGTGMESILIIDDGEELDTVFQICLKSVGYDALLPQPSVLILGRAPVRIRGV